MRKQTKFPWRAATNIRVPLIPPDLVTRKNKLISNRYCGKGRPRKSDYDYESMLDVLFCMEGIHKKQLDYKLIAH